MSESKPVLTAEQIEQRIAAAEREVSALCAGPNRAGGRSWRMTVPVDPTDSDIVFVDLIDAAKQLLARAVSHPPVQPDRPDGVLPCLVKVDGPLGSGVLIPGITYKVVEVREHREPTGVEGEPPLVSTVIRFDPVQPDLSGLDDLPRGVRVLGYTIDQLRVAVAVASAYDPSWPSRLTTATVPAEPEPNAYPRDSLEMGG